MRPTLRKVVLIALLGRDQPRRKRRSVWVQRWLKSRKQAGEFHRLIQELRLFGEEFRSYFHLDRSQFDHLLQMVGARITRMNNNYRESISPVERLAICLRFLATGDSYRTIGFSFRVGRSPLWHKPIGTVWLVKTCLSPKRMTGGPSLLRSWRGGISQLSWLH